MLNLARIRLVRGIVATVPLPIIGIDACTASRPRGAAEGAMTRSSAAPISGPAKYDPEKSILFIAKEIEMNSPSQILWEVIAEIQGSPAWNPGAANAWLNIPTRNGCRVLTEETFRSDLSYQPETFISNKRLGLPQEGFDQCEVEVETKHQRKGGSR